MIVRQSFAWPQPSAGMRGMTFDGTGLLGTGLYCWPPDGTTCSWGWGEAIVGVIGLYVVTRVLFATKKDIRRARAGAGTVRRRAAAARKAFAEAS